MGIKGPFVKDITQGRIFTYDEASLMQFLEQTAKYKTYKKSSGFDYESSAHSENYDVYVYPSDYVERFKNNSLKKFFLREAVEDAQGGDGENYYLFEEENLSPFAESRGCYVMDRCDAFFLLRGISLRYQKERCCM